MKLQILVIMLSFCLYAGQNKNEKTKPLVRLEDYVKTTNTLTLNALLQKLQPSLNME